MANSGENRSFYSDICTEGCGGSCCAPWWGIFSYRAFKERGLTELPAFAAELEKGLEARAKKIIDGYVTAEKPARPLFTRPERYRLVVKDIKIHGTRIELDLLAMLAFKCVFLTADSSCAIHPSTFGGRDIRPPHCGYMGSLHVRPNEKGYCRIIHAAQEHPGGPEVDLAIEVEKSASLKNYSEGHTGAGDAAGEVVERMRDYCARNAQWMMSEEKQELPGRNDPCWCGSNQKFKKCHGR